MMDTLLTWESECFQTKLGALAPKKCHAPNHWVEKDAKKRASHAKR